MKLLSSNNKNNWVYDNYLKKPSNLAFENLVLFGYYYFQWIKLNTKSENISQIVNNFWHEQNLEFLQEDSFCIKQYKRSKANF